MVYDLNYEEQLKAAESGDLDAMFNVAGFLVRDDPDTPLDPEMAQKAISFYEANAEAGDGDSMLDLGAMYLQGRGVPRDEKKALEWYQKGADAGAYRACRCIGNYYRYDLAEDGTPVPTQDRERLRKAFEWYRRGAEKDREENSLYELGDFYRHGICTGKDERKAFELYMDAYRVIKDYVMNDEMSLNDSYADVCLRLAECYHQGIGTEKNLPMAREMIVRARKEFRKRKAEGDRYGAASLPRAEKEWLLIMGEESDT